tara:strand:+ start:598 stop:819 length:222 start_codon:yes stop_codon:yes gene_type:complete
MKFIIIGVSIVNKKWKAVTDKGTFFISRSTSPNLGIVRYEVLVTFDDGGCKILGYDLQYLRDAKAVANSFNNQ